MVTWRLVGHLAAVMIGLLPGLVHAQTAREGRLFAGVVGGTSATSADHVSGATGSAGVTGGVRLRPWLDLEFDVLRGMGVLTRDYTGRSVSFAGPGARPEDFVITRFVNERSSRLVLAAGVSLHPRRPAGRWMPRVFAGIANHWVRDRTVLEHLVLPPGVTLAQVNRALPPGGWRSRALGGPSVGASVSIALSPHMAIVPDIRYDYGSLGDEINNVLRPSVRVLWRF